MVQASNVASGAKASRAWGGRHLVYSLSSIPRFVKLSIDPFVILRKCTEEQRHSSFEALHASELVFRLSHRGAGPPEDHLARAPVFHSTADIARGAVQILDRVRRRQNTAELLRELSL